MLRVIIFQCLHEPPHAAAAVTSIFGQCRNHMGEHFQGMVKAGERETVINVNIDIVTLL